jgi:hypothetical protein
MIAISSLGEVDVSTNTGTSWTAAGAPPVTPDGAAKPNLITISGDGSTMILVTYLTSQGWSRGHIHKSTDNGASWTVISNIVNNFPYWKVWQSVATNSDATTIVGIAQDGWAAQGSLYVSRSGGASWTNISLNVPDVMHTLYGDADLVTTMGVTSHVSSWGSIYKTQNAAVSWIPLQGSYTNAWTDIVTQKTLIESSYQPTHPLAYAMNNYGALFATSSYNSSFNPTGKPSGLMGGMSLAADQVMRTLLLAGSASGPASYIYRSADFGATWTQGTNGDTWIGDQRFTKVVLSWDGMKAFAVDDGTVSGGGKLFASEDGGVTWSVALGSSFEMYTVAMSGKGEKVAVIKMNDTMTGVELQVAVGGSISGGFSWVTKTSPFTLSLSTKIRYSADGRVIALLDTSVAGSLWLSLDNGGTWAEQTGAGSDLWQDIALSADGLTLMASGKDSIVTGVVSSGGVISEVTPANSEVAGAITWGNGSSLTLSTDGDVKSTGDLTLDITDLDQIVASGATRFINVESGGSIQVKNRKKYTVRSKTKYRLKIRV